MAQIEREKITFCGGEPYPRRRETKLEAAACGYDPISETGHYKAEKIFYRKEKEKSSRIKGFFLDVEKVQKEQDRIPFLCFAFYLILFFSGAICISVFQLFPVHSHKITEWWKQFLNKINFSTSYIFLFIGVQDPVNNKWEIKQTKI